MQNFKYKVGDVFKLKLRISEDTEIDVLYFVKGLIDPPRTLDRVYLTECAESSHPTPFQFEFSEKEINEYEILNENNSRVIMSELMAVRAKKALLELI